MPVSHSWLQQQPVELHEDQLERNARKLFLLQPLNQRIYGNSDVVI